MAAETVTAYTESLEKLQFNVTLQHVWKLISRTNKYIDETTPWVLAREERTDELKNVLAHLVESLRVVGTLLRPVLVETPARIAEQLGLDFEEDMAWDKVDYGQFPAGRKVIEKGEPIFPRLDMEEEVAAIKESMAQPKPEAQEEKPWDPEETELSSVKDGQISFEHFDKVELKVAEVIDCQKVEKADKLLKFRLDAGDAGGDRQIVSGVAEFYPNPEELIGKKVIVVANLKPLKMRGEISQGMILSAEDESGRLELLEAPAGMPNGAIVG